MSPRTGTGAGSLRERIAVPLGVFVSSRKPGRFSSQKEIGSGHGGRIIGTDPQVGTCLEREGLGESRRDNRTSLKTTDSTRSNPTAVLPGTVDSLPGLIFSFWDQLRMESPLLRLC